MENLIHADIFFFITTIIAIVLGVLVAVILAFIIKILADIRAISQIARSESAEIAEDIHMIRREVHDELRRNSSVIGGLVKAGWAMFKRRKSTITKK